MSQIILRWLLHIDENMEEWIISFLRDTDLNTELVELLNTFDSTVVKYSPGSDAITLQDIIVAYQNGKLSEWQMNSVEWFISYASEYLKIRLWVISTVEKETSIHLSDLTNIERQVLEDSLRDRFSGLSITGFSWTIEGTTKSTKTELLNIDAKKLEDESWNQVQDGIRKFIEKIKSNIFLKRNSPEWGWVERVEEWEDHIEDYIERLLDVSQPLDKELLKTIPLDFALWQQNQVICRLVKRLFPDIWDKLDMKFLADSLQVFPNVWWRRWRRTKNSRWFQFWKSISQTYLKQILWSVDDSSKGDKFLTSALRRIIVPLRFLIIKSSDDANFIEWNDNDIKVISEERLTKLAAASWVEFSGWEDVSSVTKFVLGLQKAERKDFLLRLTASIVWVPLEKIDMTHIDYVIDKYVWSISEYERVFNSSISSGLSETPNIELDYTKTREIIYWLACLRKIKVLDVEAWAAYHWDILDRDDDEVMQTFEEAHAADADEAAMREDSARPDEADEEKLELCEILATMCRDFESTEDGYESEIKSLVEDFKALDDTEQIYVLQVLELKVPEDLGGRTSELEAYLRVRYVENSDLCTKMTHDYKNLMKNKKSLWKSNKIRGIQRLVQWFWNLNSQDQERFLEAIWMDSSLEQSDLGEELYTRVIWHAKSSISNWWETIYRTSTELITHFSSRTARLRNGSVNRTDLNTISSSFHAFWVEDKKDFITYCLNDWLQVDGSTIQLYDSAKVSRNVKRIFWNGWISKFSKFQDESIPLFDKNEDITLSDKVMKTLAILFIARIKR